MLNVFKRKIIRKMYGTVNEDRTWRRFNEQQQVKTRPGFYAKDGDDDDGL